MKGWDKESLRHSFAKKFGKAPPYRKRIPIKLAISKITIQSRAEQLIDESEEELNEYEKTGKYTNYAQATEKAWQAYKQYLSARTEKIMVKSQIIKQESKKLGLMEHYSTAQNLHLLSFGGDALIEATYLRPLIQDIKKLIKGKESI